MKRRSSATSSRVRSRSGIGRPASKVSLAEGGGPKRHQSGSEFLGPMSLASCRLSCSHIWRSSCISPSKARLLLRLTVASAPSMISCSRNDPSSLNSISCASDRPFSSQARSSFAFNSGVARKLIGNRSPGSGVRGGRPPLPPLLALAIAVPYG